jgi:hypothetical protein
VSLSEPSQDNEEYSIPTARLSMIGVQDNGPTEFSFSTRPVPLVLQHAGQRDVGPGERIVDREGFQSQGLRLSDRLPIRETLDFRQEHV